MTRRPAPAGEYEERRNARIRELREQREDRCADGAALEPPCCSSPRSPGRSRPWESSSSSGSMPSAPRVMAWVEQNPGAIEHGIVQDFVQWYQPEVLADEAAASEQRRVHDRGASGATDTAIGQLLFDHGLINSQWPRFSGPSSSRARGDAELRDLRPVADAAAERDRRRAPGRAVRADHHGDAPGGLASRGDRRDVRGQ